MRKKFRAWDKIDKKMRLVKSISYADDGFSDTAMVLLVGGKDYGYIDGETCELMQYTGLIDMHGKEIFEGDILRDTESIGEVEYVLEDAGFLVFSRNPSTYHYLKSDGRLVSSEIVGNIYEAHQLLDER